MLPRFVDTGNPAGQETRTATAWALGLLNKGNDNPNLARVFAERIADMRGMPVGGEDARIRRMSAIALGQMKTKEGLGTLRRFYSDKEPSLNVVNNACGWAIEQITGEKVPPPPTIEFPAERWFLRPIE